MTLSVLIGAFMALLCLACFEMVQSAPKRVNGRSRFHSPNSKHSNAHSFNIERPPKEKRVDKPFPKHWGPEPEGQGRDIRELPHGYGYGSGTLYRWIQINHFDDIYKANGWQRPDPYAFPKHWRDIPILEFPDIVRLPGDYGHGSTTLKNWIEQNMLDDERREKLKWKRSDFQYTKKELEWTRSMEGKIVLTILFVIVLYLFIKTSTHALTLIYSAAMSLANRERKAE